jgi:hypothetical protein
VSHSSFYQDGPKERENSNSIAKKTAQGNTPFISYRYPQRFEEEQDPFASSVTQFCFPDSNQFPIAEMPKYNHPAF